VSAPESPPPGRDVPPPLTVAASLTAVEGIVLLLQGFVTQVPGLPGDRFAMHVTTLAFFVVYGVFLGFCAYQLYRLHSWARAPVVLAQLIQILVGASFWGGGTTVVSVVTVLVGVVVLAGIFHPASLAALEPS
jgi:hypothetical protein